ncbi:MAG: PQQ-binding-like beta-propeller repeat protein [Planctomycetaceae bacterium]
MFLQRSAGFAFLLCATSMAAAGDWPQWRGPNRNGISSETGLLKEWPKEGPPVVWHAKSVGDGYSTPSVVGDRIYLLSNQGSDEESVQALSAADGSQIWATPIGGVGKNTGPQYPGARSTPTVDGEYLYVLGSDGDIAAVKAASGEVRWKKNVRSEFGGAPGAWAYSESPLVDGDKLICSPGGKTATLVALNKETGDVIWKSALEEGDEAGYSSVIAVEIGGAKQYVQFLGKGLVGVDAATGRFLWRYEKTAKGSPANIPTPVANGTMIYSAAARSGGGLVRLNVTDGMPQAEEVYFKPKLPSSIGGSVNVGDYLYGTTREGFLCVEFATGEVKWQSRSLGASSILYADERLYIHGENGDLALVEATPEEYREKGRFTPPDMPDRGKSKSWTYPVIANGRLYVRELSSLWCFDVKAK